jgi:cysteine synthase A
VVVSISTCMNRCQSQFFYVGAAFVAGILVTLGFNCLPFLYLRHNRESDDLFQDGLLEAQREKTQDDSHGGTEDDLLDINAAPRTGPPAIAIGIEGCIGNTPLIRIRSLSDATGCEILAKAEV